MTLTMNKATTRATTRATTTAAAMDAYYNEGTVTDEEFWANVDWAEIEAEEMALAEAMDEALAAILDAQYWERQVDEALEVARKSGDPTAWEVYSDLYKSVYGIRPRW